MKKNTLFALLVLLAVGISASGAYALGPQLLGTDQDVQTALQNKDYDAFVNAYTRSHGITEERFLQLAQEQTLQDSVTKALDAGDYQAWATAQKALEQSRSLTTIITAENFQTYTELYKAKINGDFALAQKLAEQLGLGFGMMGHGHGMRMGHMGFAMQTKSITKTSLQ